MRENDERKGFTDYIGNEESYLDVTEIGKLEETVISTKLSAPKEEFDKHNFDQVDWQKLYEEALCIENKEERLRTVSNVVRDFESRSEMYANLVSFFFKIGYQLYDGSNLFFFKI